MLSIVKYEGGAGRFEVIMEVSNCGEYGNVEWRENVTDTFVNVMMIITNYLIIFLGQIE